MSEEYWRDLAGKYDQVIYERYCGCERDRTEMTRQLNEARVLISQARDALHPAVSPVTRARLDQFLEGAVETCRPDPNPEQSVARLEAFAEAGAKAKEYVAAVENPMRIVAVPGGPEDRADFCQDGKLVGSIVNIGKADPSE